MFVSVYRRHVHPGKENPFRAAWARGTGLVRDSYGPRLPCAAGGCVVGSAEWPGRKTRQRAFDRKAAQDDRATREAFQDAISDIPVGNDAIFSMDVTDDLSMRSRAV